LDDVKRKDKNMVLKINKIKMGWNDLFDFLNAIPVVYILIASTDESNAFVPGQVLFSRERQIVNKTTLISRIQKRIQNAMYLMYFLVSLATKNQVFQCSWGGIEVLSRRKPGFDSPWDHHLEYQGF